MEQINHSYCPPHLHPSSRLARGRCCSVACATCHQAAGRAWKRVALRRHTSDAVNGTAAGLRRTQLLQRVCAQCRVGRWKLASRRRAVLWLSLLRRCASRTASTGDCDSDSTATGSAGTAQPPQLSDCVHCDDWRPQRSDGIDEGQVGRHALLGQRSHRTFEVRRQRAYHSCR